MTYLSLFLFILSSAAVGAPAFAKGKNDFQALIISADTSFISTEVPLNYTSEDADRLARALRKAGRVAPDSIHQLKNPTSVEFNRAIRELGKADTKKFLFYYSGHSDEDGLHLKDGVIDRAKFHDLLASVTARVKVVILDSCFSGGLKTKGVKKSTPVELVQYNIDEPTGTVILTSSSDRQFSYESENLKGSIFTYHLVSGLYGQADGNSDGVVTIDELYQYVYSQTKYQSMVSGGVVQQPEFDSKLTGQGALVLSFPAKINGQILLADSMQGDLTLASASGVTFFKFFKNKGEPKAISIPYGTYAVTVGEPNRIGTSQVELLTDEELKLSQKDFTWKERTKESVSKKGDSGERQNEFLFGVALGSHPGFELNRKGGAVGELFVLSPTASALQGRWRLGAHLGGQSTEIEGQGKARSYERFTLGGEANYTGPSGWNNDWVIGFQAGRLRSNDKGSTVKPASLAVLSLGSRFSPRTWPVKLGVQLGFESAERDKLKLRNATSVMFSISY